jgi:uncharacterized membrane protein
MKAGEPVDPMHGQRAKQRSVHNTYFTLPVLVAMLSNHYGWLTRAAQLAGAGAADAGRGADPPQLRGPPQGPCEGQRVPWELRRVPARCMLVAGGVAGGAQAAAAQAPPATPVTFAQVQAVVEQRCVLCHNAQVQQKNVALHTPELLHSRPRRCTSRRWC